MQSERDRRRRRDMVSVRGCGVGLLPAMVVLVLVQVVGWSVALMTQVHVENRLGHGRSFSIHCHSLQDDLGAQYVEDGNEFTVKFNQVHFLYGATLYACDLWWGDENQFRVHFNAFDGRKDQAKCDRRWQCWWRVEAHALYHWNRFDEVWDDEFTWAQN